MVALAAAAATSTNAGARPAAPGGSADLKRVPLPPGAVAMSEAETLGAELVAKLEHDPNFGEVFIVSDTQVRVSMKNAAVSTMPGTSRVDVVVEPSKHSFKELLLAAQTLDLANSSSLGTEIDVPGNRLTMSVLSADLPTAMNAKRAGIPTDVEVVVRGVDRPETLAMAGGGMTAPQSGCTTGFRYGIGTVSTASHCADMTGWLNGVWMTHNNRICSIDTQRSTVSGNTTTGINGYNWSGTQGNVANNTTVTKFGVTSSWTTGKAGNWTTTAFSCQVTVQRATFSVSGGDSGGPVMTFACGGSGYCAYEARGTIRGYDSSSSLFVPMGAINSYGIYVG
jgi:hypothetical protein